LKNITISIESLKLNATLNETITAQKIWDSLPIKGNVNRWGEEIYFSIPLLMEEETDARSDVEIGELGYWEPGNAFCIFFGATPASIGNKPRAASPVNVFGTVEGDTKILTQVKQGAFVTVEKIK
jgi:hypothetical protein